MTEGISFLSALIKAILAGITAERAKANYAPCRNHTSVAVKYLKDAGFDTCLDDVFLLLSINLPPLRIDSTIKSHLNIDTDAID